MSALNQPVYISPEEYLLGENSRVDGIKHEYVNGLIYAMAGASRNHNRVAGNFFISLGVFLKNRQCEIFQSDMKVGIRTKNEDRFYYPDIQITCEKEENDYYNTSPCLIIEVLSNSTARTDRTEKLTAYTMLPSMQEYVLCSQDFPAIEVYRRKTGWKVEHYVNDQTLVLESMGFELKINELYGFLTL